MSGAEVGMSVPGVGISLTPGFSQVPGGGRIGKPFQRFLCARSKPFKRFLVFAYPPFTPLKRGVNEVRLPCPHPLERGVSGEPLSTRLCDFATLR
jgi:hypothetical protein